MNMGLDAIRYGFRPATVLAAALAAACLGTLPA
ncbi:cell envelope biogenesis protein OmpA, partial [Ralstonia pseudosolanacearum]